MARRLASRAEEWTVITALKQTRGRGQFKKSWYSPEGGLYFSIILKPDREAEELKSLTRLFAQSLMTFIEKETGMAASLKLPNDILMGGKKVCGILAEKTGESLIVGVGLNLNIKKFPEDLPATSLGLETGRVFDKETVLTGVLINLKDEYLKFLQGEV